jgi:hypothetical protein
MKKLQGQRTPKKEATFTQGNFPIPPNVYKVVFIKILRG